MSDRSRPFSVYCLTCWNHAVIPGNEDDHECEGGTVVGGRTANCPCDRHGAAEASE